MTFNEFKVLVKGMKAVYTSPNFLPDADSVNIWFQMLQDLDYKAANMAIQKYMLTNKFPPTIADIREASTSVQFGDVPDWGEGWEKALHAIRKFGSYREAEALASLDGLTRKCVERLGFKNLCMSEDTMADRANFRMIFEQLATRKRNESVLPLRLQHEIKNLRLETENRTGIAGDKMKLLE